MRNKAIARQYHTWFTWDASNANNFFGLFGEDFKTSMKKRCSESEELKSSIEAFLELGNTRNQLVHRDYVSFPLEKTLDELYTLYRAATVFVTNLPTFLAAHDKTGETTSPA